MAGTARKRATKEQAPPPEGVARLREAVGAGADWLTALLAAIAGWEAAEEVVDGRRYRYLIAGEAFDWLLLAERLLEELDGAVPAEEREALLFFGRPPRPLDDVAFKRAIGDAKHRAHLNFVYGVAVEEALQLAVEEEVLKERHSRPGLEGPETVEEQVFLRLYNRSCEELLAAFREGSELPAGDEISYGDLRAFIYWLFKYRVAQSDPARVASDTRKALAKVSELEAAARRRLFPEPALEMDAIVDGEVVARLR